MRISSVSTGAMTAIYQKGDIDSAGQAVYTVDPDKPNPVTVPIGSDATMLSVHDGCTAQGDRAVGASGLGSAPCNPQQFAAAVHSAAPGGIVALVTVGSTGTVQQIAQIYLQ